jgi:hypothetical protein
MGAETDEVEAAATELAHALARLVRAIDAVGDDREAIGRISAEMPDALEQLASPIGAAQGFNG